MKIFEWIGDTKDRMLDAIEDFGTDPLDSLGELIPIAMGGTALIGFVIAYIIFIVQGGYTTQVNIFQLKGMNGVEEAFTYGTVHIIYGKVVSSIINALFLGQIIVMMITFFANESKMMRIFAIIDFALFVITLITSIIMTMVSIRTIQRDVAHAARIVFLAAVILLVIFVVLTIIAESRWMLGHGVVALLVSYIFFPLLLLFLENVIPGIVGLIILAFMAGIIYVMYMMLLGGLETSGSSAPPSPKRQASSENAVQPSRVINIDGDAQLWVEDGGFWGIRIYTKGLLSGKYDTHAAYYNLDVGEFKKGRIVINVKGKKMTENDLHYGKNPDL